MSNLVAAVPPMPDLIPQHLLRNQSQYRSVGTQQLGAGLILKPTARGDYVNRVSKNYVIVYVLRGTGTFIDPKGTRHTVHAGDAVQMMSGEPNGVQQDPDGLWAEAFLTTDAPTERALRTLGAIDPARPLLRAGVDATIGEQIHQLILGLQGFGDDRFPTLLAQAHQVLAQLHVADRRRGEKSPHTPLIDDACRLIGEQASHKADLDDLLAQHGLSYERFRKIFRHLTGQSPNDYRIKRRIDTARAMLAQQRMSIKQVAYALGYPDPFTFSRQFKQVVGVSPRRFAHAERA